MFTSTRFCLKNSDCLSCYGGNVPRRTFVINGGFLRFDYNRKGFSLLNRIIVCSILRAAKDYSTALWSTCKVPNTAFLVRVSLGSRIGAYALSGMRHPSKLGLTLYEIVSFYSTSERDICFISGTNKVTPIPNRETKERQNITV